MVPTRRSGSTRSAMRWSEEWMTRCCGNLLGTWRDDAGPIRNMDLSGLWVGDYRRGCSRATTRPARTPSARRARCTARAARSTPSQPIGRGNERERRHRGAWPALGRDIPVREIWPMTDHLGQSGATDRERLYGIAGRAAGEAALAHGRDGDRIRRVTDAFVLSRIARAVVDALCDDLTSRGRSA